MMPKESREILNLSIQVLSKLAKGLFFNESLKNVGFQWYIEWKEKNWHTLGTGPSVIHIINILITKKKN